MSDTETTALQNEAKAAVAIAFDEADRVYPFGPSFFLEQLGRFVRDRCPDPAEHLPAVALRLADGAELDICHIIGVSPQWVMLAVVADPSRPDVMATEFVPYGLIRRVCIHSRHCGDGASIGFNLARPAERVTAEDLAQATIAASCHS